MREIKFRAWFPKEKEMHDWDSFKGAIIKEIFNKPGFCVLMQYTGLKDKNGVEIYEGDIVRVEHEVFEVYYAIEHDYPAFEIKGWLGDDNGLSHIVLEGDCEVIGNIYENPDLLGKDKP